MGAGTATALPDAGPTRRGVLTGAVALALLAGTGRVRADPADRAAVAQDVLRTWYRLTLELIRHTPTMTPPVASRALAYVGIAALESLAGGPTGLRSLAGQLTDLRPLPARPEGLDDAVVLGHALDLCLHELFFNTGPTGQRALAALSDRLGAQAGEGLDPAVAAASRAHAAEVAEAILTWARDDGGAVVTNMGFPLDWPAPVRPGQWVPTSAVTLQQAPLLPDWGRNRHFALRDPASVDLGTPTPYSEDPGSPFHSEALEVLTVARNLTEDQRHIARFWADEAMLSFTPPGHWTAILNQVAAERGWGLADQVDALARIGIAMADAFIHCWASKYHHDTVRPLTYIRAHLDPNWQPLILTPPFPEFPSGHSVQSSAAAAVLTALFGDGYAFFDESPAPDGVPQRSFPSFNAAADEAALSRLYGGVHFRPAIDQGQAMGRAIAAPAIALQTRA